MGERARPVPLAADTAVFGVAPEGVEVTRIGPGFFDGSRLTNAALRRPVQGGVVLADRVAVALEAVRAAPRSLVYLYWGDIDKVGHVHGPGSWEWVDELESVDRHLATLVARSSGRLRCVTADHGLVDVPYAHRVDLARWSDSGHPALRVGAARDHVKPALWPWSLLPVA